MKKFLSMLFIFVLLASNIGYAAEEVNPQKIERKVTFEDINNFWAKEDIEYIVKSGIMKGLSPEQFAPDDEITKAQFVAVLFRVLRLSPITYENVFSDVTAEDWYANMLQITYSLNILDHEIFKKDFRGEEPITRQEIASLLVNAYTLFLELPSLKDASYKDIEQFSPWAVPYINKISTMEIMKGKGDKFAPQDKMTRGEAAAVTRRLLLAFEKGGLDTTKMPWRQAPVIFRLTDEVKPGDTLTIYGCGLDGNDVSILAENTNTVGDKPSEKAVKLPAIQRDAEGDYITTILPKEFNPGISKIWVQNKYGIGNGLMLNKARPAWVATDIGYEGLEIQLMGHNFDLKRVQAEGEVKVRLSNNGQQYDTKTTKIEPYSVKFLVPEEIVPGKYDISITNDGANWSTLDNEQTFTIIEKGNDPLKLGVAWEKNYKYDNRVNVKDYGAVGDGVADDTKAIQNAIHALDEMGGGIVTIPPGNFRFSKITLPSYIIIAGEDREKSVLTWIFDSEINDFSIGLKTVAGKSGVMTGYNGVYNLKICFDPTNLDRKLPKNFAWIGDEWSNYTAVKSNDRKYEGFFYKNVTIDFPMEMKNGNHTVMRSYSILKKYYLFDNCRSTGYQSPPGMPVVGNYTRFTNNYMNNLVSSTESVGAYTIWENNELIRHGNQFGPDGKRVQAQGIFIRTNAYCAHNSVCNTGGDGEAITTDGNKQNVLMRGDIMNAALNTATVSPYYNEDGIMEYNKSLVFEGTDSWDMSYPCFGEYSILICEGKGIGQSRKIAGADKETSTVTIDKPWDVVPDSTSKFTILSLNENVFLYANTAKETNVGFQLYGAHYDCVIADNTSQNSLGVRTIAVEKRGVGSADSRFWPEYFITYRNNSCEGVSPSSKDGILGVFMHYESKDKAPFAYTGYGISIKGNTLKNISNKSNTTYGSGIRIQSSNVTAFDQNIAKSIIIEGNTLMNLAEKGISVGTSTARGGNNSLVTGIVVKDNTYENVDIKKTLFDTKNVTEVNKKP